MPVRVQKINFEPQTLDTEPGQLLLEGKKYAEFGAEVCYYKN